jgi:hypothetical protein
MSRTPNRRLLVVALVALTLAAGPAPPATAVDPTAGPAGPADAVADLQGKVDAYLAGHPGGTQVSANEIAYDNGRFIVSVARLNGAASGTADCPRGWFCFYEYTGFRHPRGQLSDCGWQDLARWGWQNRTASVHYNMPTGYVVFYNHAGGTSHTADAAIFSLDTGYRADSDVAPYRDIADHVRRFC